MKRDPFYITVLEQLGFNTTKLRWRLYRMEQRAEGVKRDGAMPSWLKWVQYQHKICGNCGAVNDRESRECHRCHHRLPSMLGYRLARTLGMMTPEGRPIVAGIFLVVIVGVYIAMLAQTGVQNFMRGFPSYQLVAWGAWTAYHEIDLRDGWRIFAFSLLHGNLMHIGFNGYAFSQIGPALESQVGRLRMLALITVTQVTSWGATYFWYEIIQRDTALLTVGASGWLFGLIGFGIAYFGKPGSPAPHLRGFLLQWAIFAFVIGLLLPGTNNAAHLGGLLGGLAFGQIPEPRGREARATAEKAWQYAGSLCLVIWIATALTMAISVVRTFGEVTGN